MPTRFKYGDRVEIETIEGWLPGIVYFVNIKSAVTFYILINLDNGFSAVCTSLNRIRFVDEEPKNR